MHCDDRLNPPLDSGHCRRSIVRQADDGYVPRTVNRAQLRERRHLL